MARPIRRLHGELDVFTGKPRLVQGQPPPAVTRVPVASHE